MIDLPLRSCVVPALLRSGGVLGISESLVSRCPSRILPLSIRGQQCQTWCMLHGPASCLRLQGSLGSDIMPDDPGACPGQPELCSYMQLQLVSPKRARVWLQLRQASPASMALCVHIAKLPQSSGVLACSDVPSTKACLGSMLSLYTANMSIPGSFSARLCSWTDLPGLDSTAWRFNQPHPDLLAPTPASCAADGAARLEVRGCLDAQPGRGGPGPVLPVVAAVQRPGGPAQAAHLETQMVAVHPPVPLPLYALC